MILTEVLYALEKRVTLTSQGFVSLSDMSQEEYVFYGRVQKGRRM